MKKIRVLVVIVFVTTTLLFTQYMLMPQNSGEIKEGGLESGYYKNAAKHDVIFIGDCEVYDNFSPVVLWEEYGINSYIRGSAQQLVWQSYYLLEDTLKYETPQAVVFNVLAMQYGEPQKESYNRMTLDGMRWSISKLKSVMTSMTAEEHLLDYILPIFRYHSRWDEVDINKLLLEDNNQLDTYNGYYLHQGIMPVEDMPARKVLSDYKLPDISYRYLEKMTELCKLKGIELILIKSPSIYPVWYDEWDEQMVKYAGDHDLKYINFIKSNSDIGIDYKVDTYDSGQHLNVFGAEKTARYLGKILAEEFGVKDRRDDFVLAKQWSDDVSRYNYEKEYFDDDVVNTNLNTADTIPPVIHVPEIAEYELGEPILYKKNLEVTDNSGQEPDVTVDDEDVVINVPGTYKVRYTATDGSGNTSSRFTTIIIRDKKADIITSQMVDDLAEDVLSEIISEEMSERERLYAVFQWCRKNMNKAVDSKANELIQGAYEGLNYRRGDCFVYNAAATWLIRKMGYEVVSLSRKNLNTTHHWCLIKTSQGWYHFDCYSRKGRECFLLTDSEASEKGLNDLGEADYYIFDQSDVPQRAVEKYN